MLLVQFIEMIYHTKIYITYSNGLKLADENDMCLIAFSSISTGIYGYPLEKASNIAIDAITDWNGKLVENIKMVCFDDKTYEAYVKAYKNSDYYKVHKKKIVNMLKDMKNAISIYLEVRPEICVDKIIIVPSVKLIDQTGEIIFIERGRHLDFVRYQVPNYNPYLFFELLKELEVERNIFKCEEDYFVSDYMTTISLLK